MPTTVVSTALAVVPCIRRPLTSLLGRPSRIAPCMRSARRSGAPTVAGAGQSGPGCCTAVIYLHTAVHTLWLTSPGVNRCLRSLSCVHRRTDARPTPAGKPRHADGHTAVGAKSCGPVSGHAHVGPRHAAGLPGSLRNLRPRKQHSGLGPGPARGRPACRSNTVKTVILRHCMAWGGPSSSGGPQIRCAHRLPACCSWLRVMPRVLA